MTYEEFIEIIGKIKLPEHFSFDVLALNDIDHSVMYWCLKVGSYRKDSATGQPAWGWSDPYPMRARDLTEQRVVFKAFAAFRDYQEHEAREAFEYEGIKVVGPHPNLHMLMRVCSGEFGG